MTPSTVGTPSWFRADFKNLDTWHRVKQVEKYIPSQSRLTMFCGRLYYGNPIQQEDAPVPDKACKRCVRHATALIRSITPTQDE